MVLREKGVTVFLPEASPLPDLTWEIACDRLARAARLLGPFPQLWPPTNWRWLSVSGAGFNPDQPERLIDTENMLRTMNPASVDAGFFSREIVDPIMRHAEAVRKTLDNMEKSYREAADSNQKENPLDWPKDNTELPTLEGLRYKCEQHRQSIQNGMRAGLMAVPNTPDNIRAFLGGERTGYLLPKLDPIWDAATVLDLGAVPDFPGEPSNGRDALKALDILLEWCEAQERMKTNDCNEAKGEQSKGVAKRNRKGGKRPLEESNPLQFQVYERIQREHQPCDEHIDTVNRLKADRDFAEQVKEAGLKLDTALVRNALACFAQRKRDQARKNQEIDPA
jgi:hypothetical protein